jgi:hypothetical protein
MKKKYEVERFCFFIHKYLPENNANGDIPFVTRVAVAFELLVGYEEEIIDRIQSIE